MKILNLNNEEIEKLNKLRYKDNFDALYLRLFEEYNSGSFSWWQKEYDAFKIFENANKKSLKIAGFVGTRVKNGKKSKEHGGYQQHIKGAIFYLKELYNLDIEYTLHGIEIGAKEISAELYETADIVASLGYKCDTPELVNTVSEKYEIPAYSFGVPRKAYTEMVTNDKDQEVEITKTRAYNSEDFNKLSYLKTFDPDGLAQKGYEDNKIVNLPYGAHARTKEDYAEFAKNWKNENKSWFEENKVAVVHVNAPVGQEKNKFSAEEIKASFTEVLKKIPGKFIAIVSGGRTSRKENLVEGKKRTLDKVLQEIKIAGKEIRFIEGGFTEYVATTALAKNGIYSTMDSTSTAVETSVMASETNPNALLPWDLNDPERGCRVESCAKMVKDGGAIYLGDEPLANPKIINSAKQIAEEFYESYMNSLGR